MRRCDCRSDNSRDAHASHVPACVASRPRDRPSPPPMPAHAASPERARQLKVRLERGTPLATVGTAHEGTKNPRNDRRQPRWGHGGNAQYRRPWRSPAIPLGGYSPHCAKQPNSTPKRPMRRRLMTSCGMTFTALMNALDEHDKASDPIGALVDKEVRRARERNVIDLPPRP